MSLKEDTNHSLVIEGYSVVLMHPRFLKLATFTELADEARSGKRSVTLQDQVAAMYEELREDLFRYLILTGVAPDEAQELCQEAFLRLYAALRKGQQIDNTRSWVFAVARNCGLNARAANPTLAAFDEAIEEQLSSPSPSPEKMLLDRERMLRLHHAVSSLSHQQRQCLHLRVEGFRYREIAEILGVGSSTVGEFLQRAITKLRKALYE
jgi:RNA polymerase sigma-70 factor (ECF subfamily)